jgi:hypothetical protein
MLSVCLGHMIHFDIGLPNDSTTGLNDHLDAPYHVNLSRRLGLNVCVHAVKVEDHNQVVGG